MKCHGCTAGCTAPAELLAGTYAQAWHPKDPLALRAPTGPADGLCSKAMVERESRVGLGVLLLPVARIAFAQVPRMGPGASLKGLSHAETTSYYADRGGSGW